MMKIEGSGSISLRHGSADPDPDPHQNVMDPQHWYFYQAAFQSCGLEFGHLAAVVRAREINFCPFNVYLRIRTSASGSGNCQGGEPVFRIRWICI
jgi:hypothetical protein